MKTKLLFKIFFASLFFVAQISFAQGGFEGNALISFLGKNSSSTDLKDLKANYKCEMANELHYLSRGGIELILKRNELNEIHLYGSSAVYGKFAGALPNKLKFGMVSGEVKRLLGKPIVSYNSGYCEYEFSNYIL
ncbi:MAG: hypothetical protein NTY88_00570 [Bacteroidetes bacterium]|nr:hypothetical protein [Bacteroidota bacterium]